jgi:hypothetical protein
LLEEAALEWIIPAADLFVASSEFRTQVDQRLLAPGSPLFPSTQGELTEQHRRNLLDLLDGPIGRFSYFDVDIADPAQREVTQILRNSDDLADRVDADQLVFLWSQSIMYSLVRRPLDAFKRAGANVTEYGRNVIEQALQLVIPQDHLARYSPQELVVRGAVKWLVVGGGGAAATALAGLPAIIVGTGLPTLLVRAFDP